MGAINYIISNTFRHLRRQWVLSILTLLTASAMFCMLGAISLTAMNVSYVMSKLESELTVQVYLRKEASPEETYLKIQNLNWVVDMKLVSPEVSLSRLEERLGQQSRATKLIGGNPLPWSIEVRVGRTDDVEILAKTLSAMAEVEDVVYAGTFIKRLGMVSALTNRSVFTMIILTIFITSLVIFNTIRLSLFSQREEIAIMSLVGATHGYIAFPFILQGIVLAGLGSIFASVSLAFLYNSGINMMQQGLPFVPFVSEFSTLFKFYMLLSFSGIGLGWICSYVSVSRYIAVATKPL